VRKRRLTGRCCPACRFSGEWIGHARLLCIAGLLRPPVNSGSIDGWHSAASTDSAFAYHLTRGAAGGFVQFGLTRAAGGTPDTISAGYVYHPCANPGHTKDRLNAYYMRMNCTDDSWENAAGEKLIIAVTKECADKKTIMFNTGAERCNHGTCRVDQEGHPHVFFRYDAGQARYSRWTGSVWTGPIAVVPGGRSQDGDMIVDSPADVRMILASSDGNTGEVGWWKTMDGGQTWAKEPPILSRSGGGVAIGALVENFIPEGMVVVSEDASSHHLYRRMLLLGADGPVKRPAAEACHIKDQLKLLEKSGATPAS